MNEIMKPIRTRFAPSPTGQLHIGGLRTALYSYAFAKNKGGKFVLRIEDTDRKRFVEGSTEKIFEMLKIFGLNWDEGPIIDGPFAPYIQSERVKEGIYEKYADKLVEEGHAYYCFCEIKDEETEEEDENMTFGKQTIKLRDDCRQLSKEEVEQKLESGLKPAIRLKVPDNETVSFFDFVINKSISWDTKNIDDVMLLKSDGYPTYHLGVVVDDHLMEISHILRGHDWLPSTPAHLLLYKFLDFELPQIGHLTDILDPDGGKLSKRKGSVTCEEFLKEGYLPEAILNFIMLLGWAPKDNREIFSLKDFVENFDKGNLQIANPIFNRKKLDWFNGEYIRIKSDEELLKLLENFIPKNADKDLVEATIPLIKERITKLSDYPTLTGFLFEEKEVDLSLLNEQAKEQLEESLIVLNNIDDWNKANIEKELNDLIVEKGWKVGDFFMNFRITITGSKFTPPITDSVAILGKDETLGRIKKVILKL